MSVFSKRYRNFFFYGGVVFDDLETTDFYNFSTDSFLIWYNKVSNCLILSAYFTLVCFQFFSFFYHLFCDCSEFSSLVRKHICLVFICLDFFFEASVFSILCFDTALYLLDSIMIVSYELFYFSSKYIEVENPISKAIEKLCIMRNNKNRSLVILEKTCHIPYTSCIEIICRFIEEENIWILYEGSCEEESCLLTT